MRTERPPLPQGEPASGPPVPRGDAGRQPGRVVPLAGRRPWAALNRKAASSDIETESAGWWLLAGSAWVPGLGRARDRSAARMRCGLVGRGGGVTRRGRAGRVEPALAVPLQARQGAGRMSGCVGRGGGGGRRPGQGAGRWQCGGSGAAQQPGGGGGAHCGLCSALGQLVRRAMCLGGDAGGSRRGSEDRGSDGNAQWQLSTPPEHLEGAVPPPCSQPAIKASYRSPPAAVSFGWRLRGTDGGRLAAF
ncbi:translation initiation factor IF-2-like [Schistocerca nitens]|uniref:translation initiation factor IF-2-like n=1 Tax=Schistocerca nitens TaxID=7011 RepID=UPI0021188256|nr:translation initiation factor IF-2-like [Schistocerca nitens]